MLKNPFEEKFAIFTVDGARNILSKPITKKEPITVDITKKLYDHYGVSSDLSDLRIYCMFSLAFAGFLRFNELVNIRFADLSFFDSHAQIFIPRAKQIFLGKGINCLLQEQAKKHVLLFVLKIILEFPRLRTRKNFYLEHYSIKKVNIC